MVTTITGDLKLVLEGHHQQRIRRIRTSKFNSDETEEVEFIIEDSMEIIDLFLKDVESAIKTASERRIIDVV